MTSVNPIGPSGLVAQNGDATATQFVNGATLDTNHQVLRSTIDALIAALGVTIRADNLLVDSAVRLRSLDPEVTALLGSGSAGVVWQPKVAVALASTANLTLSGEQTIDGILTSGSRILVKDQTVQSQNGIYVTAAGAWTRATDANTAALIGYAMCYVVAGTANATTVWINTIAASLITLGTTSLPFARLSANAGANISPAMLPVVSAATVPLSRAAYGSGAVGDALFTAATALSARQTIGITAAMDAIVQEPTIAAARAGLGPYSDALVTATGSLTARDLQKRFADFANVKDFNAKGDGVTDDTAAINAAIAAGLLVYLPAGSYVISSPLNLRSGSQLVGAGRAATTFILPAAAAFNAIVATNKSGVQVRDIGITGGGLAATLNYWGIFFDTCTDSVVERVSVYDVDCVCVRFRDSQRCVARNVIGSYSAARYAAGANAGWIVEFDGCSACVMDSCHGSSCHFGFIVLANDGLGVGGNSSDSARTRTLCTGNHVVGCTLDGFTGVGFDINACDGNTVTGCSAQNYTDTVGVDVAAFQNKHTSTADSRSNAFVGCVAKSVGTGFYSQDGSRCIFSGCTVKDAQYQALWLNAAPFCVVDGLVVDGFGKAGAGAKAIKIESGSHSCIVTGALLDPTGAAGALDAVYIDNSDGCTVDNITLNGTFTNSIDITATADNTIIGKGARFGGFNIVDLASTTIYPIHVRSQEIVLSGGAVDYPIDFLPRGMRIGRMQLVTTVAVTGSTPKGRAGRQGATATYLALTNFGTTVGATPVLAAALASQIQDGASGHIIFVGTDGAATTGKGIFVIEGVELQ